MTTRALFVALLLAGALARADDTVELLRAEGLPTALVEAKLREARLKGVPPERVRPVVERLAASLRGADRLVARGAGRDAAVSEVARTLALGVPEEALREAAQASDEPVVQGRAASAVGVLVTSGVAPGRAAKLVQRLVAAGLSERLHTVRAAVEQLEAAGLDADAAAAQLTEDAARGKAPLPSAAEHVRESEGRRGAAPSSSGAGANGQGDTARDTARGNDRERAAGRGDGPVQKEKPDKGNNGRGGGKP